MRSLSKSKLLAYRQCHRRFWLEMHQPELQVVSAHSQAVFRVGHQVGEIAQHLYDPKGKGDLIDISEEGFESAFERTAQLLEKSSPIFEAALTIESALAMADVMLPVRRKGRKCWRMVEVKSSTKVKDYYRDDCAIQSYIAREAGVPLTSISLAHIDNTWVYPGKGDYQGLLAEVDLTEEAFGRSEEVEEWITDAQRLFRKRKEPEIATGPQCNYPFECGFYDHCSGQNAQVKFPVSWLPGAKNKALKHLLEEEGVEDLRDVPDELLNEKQLRVKAHTLSNTVYFDQVAARETLSAYSLPAYFLDFEAIYFAIPMWKGTRPYQQIPFQFSLHKLTRTGRLEHSEFLDLTGKDPSRVLAEALIKVCGKSGPIYVYNASFETARIRELAKRFRTLSRALMALNERIVDLYKVAKEYYYHPGQHGSWSIKKILPSVAPDLNYAHLSGVQDGSMAMGAYLEVVFNEVTEERKDELAVQLLSYCRMDTYAMVRLRGFFLGMN